MKNLMLHADDFGLSPSVNMAILELAQNQRISGTAVMSIFEEAQLGADELKKIKYLDIGLHITLTDQALCRYDTSLVNAAGKAYSIEQVIKKALAKQLGIEDLKKEIKAQIENFMDIFGFTPHYFDGHHHVQLLKPVCQALYEVCQQMEIKNIFIRSAFIPFSFGISKKNLVLKGLSKNIKKDVNKWGWKSNEFFAGTYGKKGLKAYFQKILSLKKDNVLMMVHPASKVDDVLRSRDGFLQHRRDEYEFLKSNDFLSILNQYGFRLAYVG